MGARTSAYHRKPKAVTHSLRIQEDVFDALQEDSERKGESVNTLINQLLLGHVKYDRYLERVGMIKMTAVTFRYLLEATSDERIQAAGREAGANVIPMMAKARQGACNIETYLDYLRDTGDYSGDWGYSEVKHDGTRTVTLTHNLGDRWSLFLKAGAKTIMDSLGIEAKYSISSSALSITF